MKIFLDTSALIKLYHKEIGTADVELIISENDITEIFLSEIAKVEFSSAIWKKYRTKEITALQAQTTLNLFESDFGKFTFITIDSIIVENARALISKYGEHGLRSLDSIQLSTCVSLEKEVTAFITSDTTLESLLTMENLPTRSPPKQTV